MNPSRIAHDHIVLLLNTQEFESPPLWLSDNFNIIEGGTHAGGSSRNKLIVFEDGTYLELFNWITEPKEFMAWADKPAGLIDFALTTMAPVTAQDNYKTIHEAISGLPDVSSLGITYSEPQSGGRKRKDGVDVKWQTTRPQFTSFEPPLEPKYLVGSRLDMPFFCHDVTAREVRVPFDDKSITTHPCGAIGISEVRVVVPESHLEAYLALYRAMLGVRERWCMDESHEEYGCFEVSVPMPLGKHTKSCISIYYPTYSESHIFRDGVETVRPNPHEKWLTQRGIGIHGIVLKKDTRNMDFIDDDGHNIGRLANEGIGNSISLAPWIAK